MSEAVAASPDEPQAEPQEPVMPALREDVFVQPGPRDHAGRPTWTLFDPLRNKYFQLDEHAFQMASCWRAATPSAIADAVAAQYPWRPLPPDIMQFADFLLRSELVDASNPTVRARLQRLAAARETTLWQKLVHNYLFFRVPVLRSDRWLDAWVPRLRFLMTARFIGLSALVGLVSLVLMLRQWDSFTHTLQWFFTAEGAVSFAVTLAIVKMLHEMGHALACRRYGVRVGTMGVSFLVMWPVLYTDATDGWRLTSRWQRAVISAAGVTTELVLACYALALWLVLPDGLPRSIAFTVATTTLVMSLVVNLNPLMRFDGYFFLSDILNVPNLQERAFALARWQLRRWLFGEVGDPPEHFDRRLRLILLGYAYTVWIYRFFLFLGIAFMVYHFFFKALGVLMFMVEIWYFIIRPIRNEVQQWPGFWKKLAADRRRRWYFLGGAVLLVLLFPWRQDFVAPAQMIDAHYSRLFSPVPAMVESVEVHPGQQVHAGDVLMRLGSPETTYQREQAERDIARYRSMLDRSSVDKTAVEDRLVLEQNLLRAQAESAALAREEKRLTIVAPVNGVIDDLRPDLHRGYWVSPRDPLLTVREGQSVVVTALVREASLDGVRIGGRALFFGEARGAPQAVPLTVAGIERSAVTTLDSPYFAAQFGGEVPAAKREDGTLVPDVSVYRIHLAPVDALQPPPQRLRGWVRFEGERSTLAGRGFRLLAGTLVRESAL